MKSWFRTLNLLITDVTWNILRGKEDNKIDIFVRLFLPCSLSVSLDIPPRTNKLTSEKGLKAVGRHGHMRVYGRGGVGGDHTIVQVSEKIDTHLW